MKVEQETIIPSTKNKASVFAILASRWGVTLTPLFGSIGKRLRKIFPKLNKQVFTTIYLDLDVLFRRSDWFSLIRTWHRHGFLFKGEENMNFTVFLIHLNLTRITIHRYIKAI